MDEKGNAMDIKIKLPRKRVKEEMQRFIHKLPEFTPINNKIER